jgi:hypothetical protein
MYGALLNLALKSRKELRETVLTGASFKLFLELEPNMREAINGTTRNLILNRSRIIIPGYDVNSISCNRYIAKYFARFRIYIFSICGLEILRRAQISRITAEHFETRLLYVTSRGAPLRRDSNKVSGPLLEGMLVNIDNVLS